MKKANPDQSLRDHLLYLLSGEGAHAKFEDVIDEFPEQLHGEKVKNFPHTAWMLLEHLRIAQWDILEFSRNAKHKSPDFPSGYWPKEETPPSAAAWDKSVRGFRSDLKAMQELVANPKSDLHAPFPWGGGQTLLREAMLVADHNSYHLGQLVTLRRMLGAWKG
jgi:DinB superfamily